MAFITLDQMYAAWKRVADWVSGTSVDIPKVQVTNLKDGEFFGYSTEPKPNNATKGNVYIELDTKKVFIYDGNNFVEF